MNDYCQLGYCQVPGHPAWHDERCWWCNTTHDPADVCPGYVEPEPGNDTCENFDCHVCYGYGEE